MVVLAAGLVTGSPVFQSDVAVDGVDVVAVAVVSAVDGGR